MMEIASMPRHCNRCGRKFLIGVPRGTVTCTSCLRNRQEFIKVVAIFLLLAALATAVVYTVLAALSP